MLLRHNTLRRTTSARPNGFSTLAIRLFISLPCIACRPHLVKCPCRSAAAKAAEHAYELKVSAPLMAAPHTTRGEQSSRRVDTGDPLRQRVSLEAIAATAAKAAAVSATAAKAAAVVAATAPTTTATGALLRAFA